MELQAIEQKAKELAEYGDGAVKYASELTVETKADMETASGMREAIKDRHKGITAFMKPLVDAAHKAHKALTTRRSDLLKPLDEAETILNKKMVAWQVAEEARLAEEQKKLDEQAKLEAAIQAEEEGNEALSEAIIENQIPVTAPPVEKAKTSGVSFVETWTYEIEDVTKIPTKYMIPDEKAIKKVVTAMKSRAEIPGIRVFAQKSIKSARKDMTKRSF